MKLSPLAQFINRVDSIYDRVISGLLFICTMVVLLLSVLVIFLRWFETTLLWYDPFVRHMVFLLAFLGGVKATRGGTHIAIDLVSRSLEKGSPRLKRYHQLLVAIVSFFVLGWLVYAGYRFTEIELAYGRLVFLGIHSAALVAIIPLGFALIALQYLLTTFKSFLPQASGEVS